MSRTEADARAQAFANLERRPFTVWYTGVVHVVTSWQEGDERRPFFQAKHEPLPTPAPKRTT